MENQTRTQNPRGRPTYPTRLRSEQELDCLSMPVKATHGELSQEREPSHGDRVRSPGAGSVRQWREGRHLLLERKRSDGDVDVTVHRNVFPSASARTSPERSSENHPLPVDFIPPRNRDGSPKRRSRERIGLTARLSQKMSEVFHRRSHASSTVDVAQSAGESGEAKV